MTVIPDGYYAVADPDNPDVMVCQRRHSRPKPSVKTTLHGEQRSASRCRSKEPNERIAWWDDVFAAIEADPQAAMKRFADFTGRCCICGRKLTDPRSKLDGMGPECRKGGAAR